MPDAPSVQPVEPRARALLQQRRLLVAAAALVGAYYLACGAVGLYPVPAALVGLGIPALLAAAAWRLPAASPRGERAWLLAVTTGTSALALATAALGDGTRCVGFQVAWALPLVYTLLVPTSVPACAAGAAVSIAGGLALMVRDGHPPWQVAQWLAMALGAAAFSVHRVVLNRRDQAALAERDVARESRLQKMEDRVRLLAEHTHDVIWTLDPATRRFTFVSPSILSQRGYTVQEALALPFEASLTEESLARALAVLATIGTGREQDPHVGLYAQPCKDGSIIEVEITATVVRDAAGRPVEVAGVSRDVTARVRAERALRRSEERFRALTEKSTDMILVLDRDERVAFWSPSAEETLGWSAGEVQGRALPALALVHPDDLPAWDGMLRAVDPRRHGAPAVRLRLRTKGGAWRLVEGLGRDLTDDPAVRGVVVNARDVTEQVRLEAQVQQAQRLESVGRLAGGVAHDFNNLLTVILSCAEAVRRDTSAGAAPDPEDLAELKAAGTRARELTAQLLAFARRQPVAPVALDLDEVVRGSGKLLRRVLGEDVLLQVEPGAQGAAALCDPGQLDQVILNLAVNARDAMPTGGVLTLATRAVRVGPGVDAVDPELVPGDWVQLEVRDTGVGMTGEVKARLFEPFFTTKPPGQGTGLGLATVYGLVRQAGGHLHVTSEPGRGASFRVCLPRATGAEAAAAAPPSEAAPRPAGGHERLLVVEDDELVRGVTVRVLRSAGYQVVAAAGGAEALELAGQAEPPGLVVTDVVMPGLGGREVAEALRARWPDLPVLFVSGYTRDAIGSRELARAGTAFLPKPFTPEGLLAQVRRLLDAR